MLTLVTGWSLGLLLGMRHALEPDHLAAVSTLVAERPRLGSAALLGAVWGLGHTAALLIAGGLLLALRAEMPLLLADLFELAVAVMLLLLGARSLLTAYTSMQRGQPVAHDHRRPLALKPEAARPPHRFVLRPTAAALRPLHRHSHRGGPVAHLHVGRITVARRPLLIGLMHGLAGSGALTALVLASMPSTLSAVVYMVLFGAGSLTGMALLTGFVGLSLRRMAGSARAQALLVAVAGTASVVFGIVGGVPLACKLLGR
jgi:hypothetical protein